MMLLLYMPRTEMDCVDQSRRTMVHVIFACLLAGVLLAKGVTSVTEEEVLHLISQTDPARRPVNDSTQPVQVSLSIAIVHLVELDEKKQALSLGVWTKMEWVNELVRWDSKDSPNVVAVPFSRVWIPDTYIQNSFSGTSDQLEVFMPQGRLLNVFSNGLTEYTPSLHLEVSCPVDTTYFPFDTQQCLIHAGSWAYGEDLVNISFASPPVFLGSGAVGSSRVSNSQWEITSVKAERESVLYENFDSSYSELKFILTLRRRPLYHMIHIGIPIFLLHMLSLTTFLVPPEGGERMSVGLTTFLSFSVFSLVLMEQLPESSVSLPIISIYVITALAQNLASILWSVYVVRAWLRPPGNCFNLAAVSLPTTLIRLVSIFTLRRRHHRMCACVNLFNQVASGERDKSRQTLESEHEPESAKPEPGPVDCVESCCQQEDQIRDTCLWHSSLDAVDRFFFLVTLTLVILCIFGIFIVLPNKQGYH